ncbi:hypothetical protein PVK06_029180 [Gossypium arboreum]|uniref:Uncharacterized protein n=1 Tax=Gossypium arboreum TaxID=29729 RepID=A0ABR0P5W6_GOSAR|nr:hypothetical protein PVK06_029180 [Gossypium arboreum]
MAIPFPPYSVMTVFQIWRYGATDETLLRNIHYSALEQTQIEVQTLEGQMEPEVLLAGSIDGSFRNFESDTSSERPSTSIVENRVVPDCELHPEMNFELSDTATLEQRLAYKIELQVVSEVALDGVILFLLIAAIFFPFSYQLDKLLSADHLALL